MENMWDILNINTFWGSVFSAVIAGIILLLIPHLLLRISHLLKFFKLVARKIKIIFAMHLTVRFCLQSMLLVVFASLLLLGVIFGETTYTPKNSDIFIYISEIRGGLIFPKKSSYDIPEWLIEARKDFYPNTFGISSWKGSKTFYLLSSYTAFDSAVLRKKG